ncbi:MAG: hypothetical protein NXI31_05035 [bacterium]|nr:hypothetical protein [bacterium]
MTLRLQPFLFPIAASLMFALSGCESSPQTYDEDLEPRGHPRFQFLLGWSPGTVTHDTRSSSADGDADANGFRVRIEGVPKKRKVGLGIDVVAHRSEDDLFGAAAMTESRLVDGFGYVYGHLGGGDLFTIPLRGGITIQSLELDAGGASPAADTEWTALGFRLEVEPELRLLYGEDYLWSVYAGGGFGVGVAEAEVDGVNDTFEASSRQINYEIGTRFEYDGVFIGVGYMDRRIRFNEATRNAGGSSLPGIENEFSGLFVSGGVRF